MPSNNLALRLPHSIYDAVRQAAADDGVAINQYINVAVAEKLACRRTAQQFLDARAKGGSAKRGLAVLAEAA
jgi:hypothetical protein